MGSLVSAARMGLVFPSLPHTTLTLFTADIFGSGDSADDVATQWYGRYQANDALAVTELVNCILQCAGCDQQVTEDDIRDPDNCHNRLADLQSIYEEVRMRIPFLAVWC
jgi:hypothetical protein